MFIEAQNFCQPNTARMMMVAAHQRRVVEKKALNKKSFRIEHRLNNEHLGLLSFRTLVRNLDYDAVRFLLTSFVEMTR